MNTRKEHDMALAAYLTNKPVPTAWRVIINGKDSGIVETNAKFAFPYWSQRHIQTGSIIRLVPIEQR